MPNGIGRAVLARQVLCTVHGQWRKKNDWQFSNPRIDTDETLIVYLYAIGVNIAAAGNHAFRRPPFRVKIFRFFLVFRVDHAMYLFRHTHFCRTTVLAFLYFKDESICIAGSILMP